MIARYIAIDASRVCGDGLISRTIPKTLPARRIAARNATANPPAASESRTRRIQAISALQLHLGVVVGHAPVGVDDARRDQHVELGPVSLQRPRRHVGEERPS